MEKSNTKQEILKEALTLFSTQGFETTTVSQIALAVGIKKASLYSHFASKQDILDELIDGILKEYDKHSIFTRIDWNDEEYKNSIKDLSVTEIAKTIIGQIQYILHDPIISKSRKMLTIEQFRNKQMSQLQTKQNYTDVMKYFTGLICFCIERGKLKDYGAKIMAAQLCLPISTWLNLCDRDPSGEVEVMALIETHIQQFFKIYSI